MTLVRQLVLLFVLPIPIASIAWTVTHEEMFREPRDWCAARSKSCQRLYSRKFFYLFTCEYCFSHYITAFFLFITRYQLLFDDWRGYLIAGVGTCPELSASRWHPAQEKPRLESLYAGPGNEGASASDPLPSLP
jgi:hypothetical protein